MKINELKQFVEKNKKLTFACIFLIATISVVVVYFLKFNSFVTQSNFSEHTISLPTYVIIAILIAYLAIWISLYFKIIENKISLNLLYAGIVFFTGFIYLIVITPYSEADSTYHFNSSYKLSNVLLGNFDGVTEINENHYTHFSLGGHYNISQWYEIIEEDKLSVNNVDRYLEMAHIHDSLSYPILYLPQALGIAFARILNLNYIGVFLLGRLFNLLFFSGSVYISMRTIPRFRLSVFAVAMIPMTLQLASGFTYDTMVNALALLFVSTVVAAIFKTDQKITVSEKVRLIAFGALLCPAKIIYSLLLFLVFLIPSDRFNSRKNYFGFLGVFGLGCIVLFSATELVPTLMWATPNASTLNWEGYNNYTLSYVFENPISTLLIFIRTTIEKAYFYFTTAFGGSLSGLSLNTYIIIPILSALTLIFTGIATKEEKTILSIKQKIVLGFICVSIYGGVLMSMFLGWTSDYRTIIEGVQGRYFIPIMLPAVMLLSTKKFKLPFNPSYVVVPITLIVNAIAIYNVLRYTMVH